MAEEDTTRPTTDGETQTPPEGTEFTPAVPLKNSDVEFESDAGGGGGIRQQLTDASGKVTTQARDRVRSFAEMGKERAGGALDQLAEMLTDAAGQVDGAIGEQYGQYARSAAEQVQGFSQSVRNKDLDELVGDARELVRKSPAIAIGAAAAVGFVLARLIQSGLDAERT
ncbi:hypothetical protein [Sphingomonas sp.]|uniref:hypothetical protein n=1 Tax=Sphingomonas sp. TaxID=28214 RepID=UPI003CC5401B